MPTLLAINNYYYRRGGAETVFLEHARLFERHGWAVIPFAMRHAKNLETSWSSYFVDEIEFGQRYTFKQKLERLPRVIYSRQARTNLGRLLDDASVDICHAHNIYHHISPSILGLLHSRGVPTVLTLHDLKIACPAYTMLTQGRVCERCKGGRLYNVLIHRCLKQSLGLSFVAMVEAVLHDLIGSYRSSVDIFVVPSRFYLRKFVEWGLPEAKFRHVPNFVNAEAFIPDYAPGQRVLFFGRLSKEKGLRTLLRAAALSGCPISIAGVGPELETLHQIAASEGADVEFLGHLTGEHLHAAVRHARAVVLPSEWYENAPMSVIESYALGKPVIGADIGGIPEVILDGETGFRFPSGDARALAGVLQQVQAVPDAALADMGRAGRVLVEKEFTATMYLNRIQAIYGELGVHAG
jgi:glycosyltransferase involved in cell wall biosynthesis